MSRRLPYIDVKKNGMVRPAHVHRMGDRAFRVFQCINPDCTQVLCVDERDLEGRYEFTCPACSYVHHRGGSRHLFDYELLDRRTGSTFVDEVTGEKVTGIPAVLSHDEYIDRASRWKYCILCAELKPLGEFDTHNRRATGRQGECNLCKQGYNSVKNGTRLIEQHREAAERRRLIAFIKPDEKLDVPKILKRFESRCFFCSEPVRLDAETTDPLKANFDHTRPAFYLWPLTTTQATLLCREHNGDKGQCWPGEFYGKRQLEKLAGLTGIPYRDLAGPAYFNPDALALLKQPAFIERLFQNFARYPDEVLNLRNRILREAQFDFLDTTANISEDWRKRADHMLR